MSFTNYPGGITSLGMPVVGSGTIPAANNYWFVDSGTGSNGNDGSWESPYATLAYVATNKAAANDVIVLKAGHTETIIAAGTVTLATAGVQVIGLGTGSKRPTFTFSTAATASLLITGAGVSIRNILCVAGIDSLTNPIHIQAADCTLDVEWRDASDTVEAVRAVLTTTAADRLKVRLVYDGRTGGDACVNAIRLVGCNDGDIVIDAYGKASTAWVEFHTTACTNISVRGRMYNSGTTDGSKNVIDTVTGSTWDAEVFDSTAGAPYSGGSGSTLAKDDLSAVTDALYGANGVSAWPTAAAYGNAVSLAEVLGYIQDGVRKGAGTAMATNKSIADALGTDGNATTDSAVSIVGILGSNTATTAFSSASVVANHDGNILERIEAVMSGLAARSPTFNSPNYFVISADMTSATWNTVATHALINVTGLVRFTIIPQCTSTLTDAADGASIQLGITGTTNAIIASTGAAGAGGNTIETGEFWIDATPADVIVSTTAINNLNVVVQANVGYEITGAALTGGMIKFHVYWSPLDATGACTAGNGSALT